VASLPADATVAVVPLLRPLAWLARGWQDLWRQPAASLFYGLAVTLAGWALLLLTRDHPSLFAAAVSGFLLLGPLLATGLYELSRAYEAGEPVGLLDSMRAWRRNRHAMIGFGVLALLIGTFWLVISIVILAVLYHGNALQPLDQVRDILVDPQHMAVFLAYLGIGGLLAAGVFALSVVTMPMLLDRRGELFPAIGASLAAVNENPLPMALWATLIMLLTLIGFVTALLGLIVIMPWLGHASWHCYRDVVR
jgi:uncharacterized membrane protein